MDINHQQFCVKRMGRCAMRRPTDDSQASLIAQDCKRKNAKDRISGGAPVMQRAWQPPRTRGVPLDFKRNSILYRIASNKRKFYLSTNVIDLGKGMEEGSPTFGGRPTWLGKLEDDRQGHERLELIVKRIKDALQPW
ncbi:hypothetical protein H4Q26_010786 [Puccinia striiformis f. sp. tritici PST-130]|nr:hypothetical protein H4Q26_010786 [Puccinia striiformis f. sp. tritici PST-130]